MAWNPQIYNPMNYQPYPMQYQQPVMQQPTSRTVEVVQVDTEEEAAKWQVQMGATLMMFARNDSFIAMKSVGVNGQEEFAVYDKRPPAPPAPVFDPTAYVTKEELESRLASFSAPKKAVARKEDAE